MKSDNPHFWWIISLLILIIIGLVSFICISERVLCSEKILEYISYTATILSITLSVFAIQYTYYSIESTRDQLTKINSTADKISDASTNIISVGAKLESNIDTILGKVEEINTNQHKILDRGQTNSEINSVQGLENFQAQSTNSD